MHSNVAQISCILLEFPLLTMNEQIMATRPEMCIIEKAVLWILPIENYVFANFYQPSCLSQLPYYYRSEISSKQVFLILTLFDRVASFPFPFSIFRRRYDLDDKRTDLEDDTR